MATGTKSGWATQVPSNPSFASRILSSRTLAKAISFAAGSLRLEMNLHLREVEVGARPPGEELLRVVEEVQSEIHEAPRSDLAVDPQMLLGEMPSAGPHHQGRGLVVQSVLLPLRAAEFERAPDGPDEVQLALDDVPPRGCIRVLEVRHEHARPGVEGVDHHLAI